MTTPVEKPSSYCEFVEQLEKSNVHRIYHDKHYGFPVGSDNELYGRLLLEINQAGLSWTTILKRQENFRKAFSGFDIGTVAKYKEKDAGRLMGDPGIIRNKLKINAAIFNARKIVELQKEFGSFKAWLNHHRSMKLEEWVKLFKKTFKFTGGEITKEFLVSTGYLKGAHEKSCPVFAKAYQKQPVWSKD